MTKNKSATPEKRTHSWKSENSSTINNDSVTNKNTPDRWKSKFTYQFVRSHPQKKYVSKIPNIIQTKLISKEAANDANVLSVKNNRNKESEVRQQFQFFKYCDTLVCLLILILTDDGFLFVVNICYNKHHLVCAFQIFF